MNISNNYFSLVAIGSFNPAILRPEFLVDVCKIDNLGKPIETSSSQLLPVTSQIKYPAVELNIDLQRFVLKETLEVNLKTPISLSIFDKYIQTLKYTPLSAVGINFNLQLIPESENEVQKTFSILQDPQAICSFFNTSKLRVKREWIHTSQAELDSGYYYIIPISELERYRLDLQKPQEKPDVTLNFNFEITYQNNLNILTDGFPNILATYEKFLALLKG